MVRCDHRLVLALAITSACNSADVADAGRRGRADAAAGSNTSGTGGDAAAKGGAAPGGSSGGSSDADPGGESASGGSISTGGSSAGEEPGSGGSGDVPSAGSSSGGGLDALGGSAGTSMAGLAGTPAGGLAGVSGIGGVGGVPVIIGGCDNQLLENADFEAGPSPKWREESSWAGIEIIVSKDDTNLQAEGVAPHTGSFLGWLGGVPDNMWDHELVILRQDIAILPTDATTLTLSGYCNVKSADEADGAYDVAYLELDDDDGDVLWQAQAWTNQTTTNGWVRFESSTDVASNLRGKTLTFVAYSNTDPEGKTSFFIDDLRLEASCGR
jgi:hypothetical protein